MDVSIREVRDYICIIITILLSSFFNSKHSFNSMHVLVQPQEKSKKKMHIEVSICETYIVEEISTFILYYFMPHLRTRINRVLRHDDGGEVPLSVNLSILSHL
jgi:hypothetical protein